MVLGHLVFLSRDQTTTLVRFSWSSLIPSGFALHVRTLGSVIDKSARDGQEHCGKNGQLGTFCDILKEKVVVLPEFGLILGTVLVASIKFHRFF